MVNFFQFFAICNLLEWIKDMSCFPCFGSRRSKRGSHRRVDNHDQSGTKKHRQGDSKQPPNGEVDTSQINAKNLTFRELATATKYFRHECLLGEGGFGRVYKGTLQSTGQVVAVKQLDRHGMQGNKEFLGEVLTLSLLHHPNLVNLIGYCADGDQRLLVHEFIPGGTLEARVLDNQTGKVTLDWYTRVKIAYGAALGLEYLHEKANPPVICRDFKASNILLDEEFNPKISDVGLAKLGNAGDRMHGPSRLMDSYGFCAPEYSRTGEATIKSDVYSYGVLLLELITGRRAIDTTRANDEQNLVAWAQPLFKDPKKYPDMADQCLNKQFPEKDLNQVVAMASMCLQEEPSVRPFMSDVVTSLSFLSTTPPPVKATLAPAPAPTSLAASSTKKYDDSEQGSGSDDDDSSSSSSDSSKSSDNNRQHSADYDDQKLHQHSGIDSKEWLSFGRDFTDSSLSKSSSDQGTASFSKDKYGSGTSRSNSLEANEGQPSS